MEMPSSEEKAPRKALKESQRQAERKEFRASLPISVVDLRNLFDYLDEHIGASGCDDTLQLTLAYLAQKKLPAETVTAWLKKTGGYCDCEVLANVEERFLSAFRDECSS